MITLVDFKNIIQSKLKDFLKCLICESVLVQIKLVLLVFNKGLVLTDFYFKIKPVNSVIWLQLVSFCIFCQAQEQATWPSKVNKMT